MSDYNYIDMLEEMLMNKHSERFYRKWLKEEWHKMSPPVNVACPCETKPEGCSSCLGNRIQPIPFTELKGVIDQPEDLQYESKPLDLTSDASRYRGLVPGSRFRAAGKGIFFTEVSK